MSTTPDSLSADAQRVLEAVRSLTLDGLRDLTPDDVTWQMKTWDSDGCKELLFELEEAGLVTSRENPDFASPWITVFNLTEVRL